MRDNQKQTQHLVILNCKSLNRTHYYEYRASVFTAVDVIIVSCNLFFLVLLTIFLPHRYSVVILYRKMSDTSDLDRQIEQLKRCEIIMEAEVKALCAKAREILVEESNVQRVDSPVTVINFIY